MVQTIEKNKYEITYAGQDLNSNPPIPQANAITTEPWPSHRNHLLKSVVIRDIFLTPEKNLKVILYLICKVTVRAGILEKFIGLSKGGI